MSITSNRWLSNLDWTDVHRGMSGISVGDAVTAEPIANEWRASLSQETQVALARRLRDMPTSQNNNLGYAKLWLVLKSLTLVEKVVSEADTPTGKVTVTVRIPIPAVRIYTVRVNDEIRHPCCAAEDVIRALAHYLHACGTQLIRTNSNLNGA